MQFLYLDANELMIFNRLMEEKSNYFTTTLVPRTRKRNCLLFERAVLLVTLCSSLL